MGKRRALISVSDKTGIVEFARQLAGLGFEIVSTGGTHTALADNGVPVTGVSDITHFPECLDGRVKTLHPAIHGGLLAMRGNAEHMKQLEALNITPIDIVVVNLYPFKQTILKPGVSFAEAIENIDIGGPSMLRAAAKNYQDVAVLTDPADYGKVLDELRQTGEVDLATKKALATKVFAHTAHYDSLIAAYLSRQTGAPAFPPTLTLTYEKAQDLRYGENPHQSAAFYKEVRPAEGFGLLTELTQLHGKELSFNNINDTNGALALLREFTEPTVVACKHATPCGVGSAETIAEAYAKAYACDPTSIYGGIITANREVDADTARQISSIFVEIVLAPSFSAEALEILTKKKNIRLLTLPAIQKLPDTELDIKKVSGGILVQQIDNELLPGELQYVTDRKPTDTEMQNLIFAWKLVKHVKSNGIAIAKGGQSIGMGGGQVNRIWACRQAIEHGVENLGEAAVKGAALASDAYFPFADSVEAAVKAGITAIIQPGGSVRDQDSIDVCNANGIAMVFTGLRHFRH